MTETSRFKVNNLINITSEKFHKIFDINKTKPKIFTGKKVRGKTDANTSIEEVNSLKMRENSKPLRGISIIVLTYDRMNGLKSLLQSIINQNIENVGLELILCNNYEKVDIRKSIGNKIINALNKKADLKIIQSNYNWRDQVRYGLTTLAKFNTILFLDDDLILVNLNFIQYMYENFLKLRETDILSCWNLLWTKYTKDYFSAVGLTFFTPEITEITQSDVCGTGVCMFNRKIIFNSAVFDIATARQFPNASYGMLNFHADHKKNALHQIPGIYDARNGLYKTLFKKGYVPVTSRAGYLKRKDSPEHQAIINLKPITQKW